METLKIALISTSVFPVPPKSYGGLERVVYDLAVELIKKGHEVTLFAPKGSKVDGATIIPTCNPNRNFLDEYKAYQVFKDKLKGFDIVHGHTWFGHEYLVKMKNPEIKVCHTHHGEPAWQTPPPVLYPNLIGISKTHALQLSRHLGVNTRYVYNGIDLNRFKLGEEKKNYMLFFSRITKFKGAHIAIDIAKRTRIPLIVAGGDTFVDDVKYVHRIMAMCDGGLIKYLGEVDFKHALRLLQNARLLLFPTLMNEPFGLVAVEALACGTPVVALNNGAVGEIIENWVNGFVCKDVDEMIESVITIFNGYYKEMKPEKCRKTVEKFSRENMAENYLKLYKSILDGDEW
ncbi:MAG: glycosyltransferase family 4 protein [Candidatus Baldrarchaeia archaeon]